MRRKQRRPINVEYERVDAQHELNRAVLRIRTALGASEVRIVCDTNDHHPMTIGPGPWQITAMVNDEERQLATGMESLPAAITCAEHAAAQALAAAHLDLAVERKDVA